MTSRRKFLSTAAVASGTFFTQGITLAMPAAAKKKFEITKSDAEWQRILTPAQYQVLRAGCKLPVYPSSSKFKSGTGWPSFWKSLPGAVGTKPDNSLFMRRTEVHCRRCGGHLGHIFDDGPKPTGKRHCLNGVALTFSPKKA